MRPAEASSRRPRGWCHGLELGGPIGHGDPEQGAHRDVGGGDRQAGVGREDHQDCGHQRRHEALLRRPSRCSAEVPGSTRSPSRACEWPCLRGCAGADPGPGDKSADRLRGVGQTLISLPRTRARGANRRDTGLTAWGRPGLSYATPGDSSERADSIHSGRDSSTSSTVRAGCRLAVAGRPALAAGCRPGAGAPLKNPKPPPKP
jgi:hypothetical protein